MCTSACTHTHTRVCMHTNTHTNTNTHTHTHTRTNVHTHMHKCTHTHMHKCTHTHPQTYMRTHTHTHMHACTHAYSCSHACAHTHMHACMHMHTHSVSPITVEVGCALAMEVDFLMIWDTLWWNSSALGHRTERSLSLGLMINGRSSQGLHWRSEEFAYRTCIGVDRFTAISWLLRQRDDLELVAAEKANIRYMEQRWIYRRINENWSPWA